VLNEVSLHEDVWVSEGITPRIHNFGTKQRWVIRFTPLPLYFWGKSPRYPLTRRLGGLQSRSRRCGEKKKKSLHCPYRELNPVLPARNLFTVLTELHSMYRSTFNLTSASIVNLIMELAHPLKTCTHMREMVFRMDLYCTYWRWKLDYFSLSHFHF
jgi:hypothetical protein